MKRSTVIDIDEDNELNKQINKCIEEEKNN